MILFFTSGYDLRNFFNGYLKFNIVTTLLTCFTYLSKGCFYNQFCIYSLWNSGTKSVGNKMPRQFQNFLVCIVNASAKKLLKTQQKSLYIMSAMASPTMAWHFIKGYDLVFLTVRLLALPTLYCLLIPHLNWCNRRQYFSCW